MMLESVQVCFFPNSLEDWTSHSKMTLIEYLSSLGNNPYFGAGAGLFGMGVLAAVGRKGLQGATIVFRRNLMITMEVTSRDKSYQWLLQWITKYGTRSQHLSVETEFQESAAGQVKTRFHFVPSPGSHYFWYNKNLVIVERNRDNKVMEVFETVTLTAFGRNRELFMNILTEARNLALLSNEGQTMMYSAVGPEWRPLGYPRRKRPLNSVILDRGVSERIFDDIQGFINNSKWYIERGIPYRRGYLLYGPPGCGKSSYIMALAGAIDYSICVLNLSDKGMSDDRLTHLLTNAPEQSIILLEDIDAAFVSRDVTKENSIAYQGMGRLTLSGLLNALDGVASAEARILFMTTNYIERLDKALIRPGRVDLKEYVGHATDYQLQQMFRRFYPDEPESRAQEFSQMVMSLEQPVSAAQVQGFFMMYKKEPDCVVKNIKEIVNL
ncbi:mitochondrial chaperone BCS1-like isoform X1 [Biomphalaria glabrata]